MHADDTKFVKSHKFLQSRRSIEISYFILTICICSLLYIVFLLFSNFLKFR
jgi:hypothetical protein